MADFTLESGKCISQEKAKKLGTDTNLYPGNLHIRDSLGKANAMVLGK